MGFFNKLFGSKSQLPSYTKINRTRVLDGINFPAFIKKNHEFFFSDLEIYEDGVLYCNDFVDQDLIKFKLDEQYLNFQVPNGEKLYINNLGSINVIDATWEYSDTSAFLKQLKKIIKELNPSLQNLYDFHGDNTHEVNGVKLPKFTKNSSPYYEKELTQISNTRYNGLSTNIFYQDDNKDTYLAQLSIYKDGTIKITRIPEPLRGHIHSINDMFTEGISSQISINQIVKIIGIGQFTVTDTALLTEAEKIQEITQLYNSLQ